MAQEPDHYTTSEVVKSAALIGWAVVRHVRGKDLGTVDAAVKRLQAKAVEREEAEKAARAEAEAAKLAAKAKAKAERRASGWL